MIGTLILIISLLHYFIPRYTILMSAILCLVFSLIIVFSYRNLLIAEYKASSLKIFYVFLLLHITPEEAIFRIEWTRKLPRESIFTEIFKNINPTIGTDFKLIDNLFEIDNNILFKNHENMNELPKGYIKLSNIFGTQDTLITYTHPRAQKKYKYSGTTVLITAIMLIMAYVTAKPILMSIIFIRYPFQFFKQQNRIRILLLEKNYTELLLFCLFYSYHQMPFFPQCFGILSLLVNLKFSAAMI